MRTGDQIISCQWFTRPPRGITIRGMMRKPIFMMMALVLVPAGKLWADAAPAGLGNAPQSSSEWLGPAVMGALALGALAVSLRGSGRTHQD